MIQGATLSANENRLMAADVAFGAAEGYYNAWNFEAGNRLANMELLLGDVAELENWRSGIPFINLTVACAIDSERIWGLNSNSKFAGHRDKWTQPGLF